MRVSIQHKITVIFIVIITILLTGIYFYLGYNLRQDTLRRIKNNLVKQVDLARFVLEQYPPDDFRTGKMDALAGEISSRLGVRVTIIDAGGTVRGDSDLDEGEIELLENHGNRPEVISALETGRGESIRFSETIGEALLYTAESFRRGEAAGVIRLAMPLAEVRSVSVRLRKLLAASLGIAFLCALGISFSVFYFITRPLKEAALTARAIAHGDFSRSISAGPKDEVGDLSRAINHMSGRIKATIEEVSTNKARLETVLLSMVEGVMVVDPQGIIVLMNRALREVLSPADDPVGRRPLEVIRNIEIQEIAEKAAALKEGMKSHEVCLFSPEEKVLFVNAVPLRQENRTTGTVLVFHDITELRRLERIRRDFVANVSHELRTPVASIKGYAETLLEGALEDKENVEDFLRIIHDESDRISKVIDDLLDLSRIESGQVKMTPEPCELPSLVERVIAGIKPPADKKGVVLKTEISSSLPPVMADRAQLIEVLMNLVDNAVKYTDAGGEVVLSAQAEEDMVRIDVSDTGIGIPRKDIPRIFERFYRVDKARSRRLGGTGLGLSIVKHIVQAHRGTVSVQSIEGKGSVFSITFPAA